VTTITPCRGHGRLYDDAVNPRGPTARRHQARITAAALCSRCPIAGSCEDRITPPSPRTLRKAAMSAEPITPVPESRPVPRQAPQLVQATPDAPRTNDELIAWGAAHPSSRIQALAGKASASLNDLKKAYEQAGKVADAEARIKRLRAQLANAERDLAAAKGVKPKTTAGPAVDYTAVRAWAAEQGIPVGPTGRPKREVVDAYLAAQQAA
jgi:hypothetical protein